MKVKSPFTPAGMLSMLAALSVVCSLILSVPIITQHSAGAPPGDTRDVSSPYAAASYGAQSLSIPGLDGLDGFVRGENQISLATYMVSEDGDQLYFEVVGLALSSPDSPQSTVYTLSKPLMGVLDCSASTIQIDMSGLAASLGSGGTIDKADLYSALRSNTETYILNLDAAYDSTSDDQVIFDVDSASFISPDGTQDTYSLQAPVQLAIDTATYRMSFPSFPQLTDDMYGGYDSYIGGGYSSVGPVSYPVPVPVAAPVAVPVYIPVPIPVAPVLYVPYVIPQPYFINTFSPYCCENDFAIPACAAAAACYGGDSYGACNDIAPYIYGGGGAALAAASSAYSGGCDYGGVAAAAAAAAAASSGYSVPAACAATAAASGGWGSAAAAAAAAAAASSGGADFGGAATAAAAAAAAASGGRVSAVVDAVATSVGGQGASAAAAAASAAASGGADYGGVAASASAAAAAASGGDPYTAVQHLASTDIGTPGARAALDAADSARRAGDDSHTISKHVEDATVKDKGSSSGHVATPTPKTKPLSAAGPAKQTAQAANKKAAPAGTAGMKRGATAIPSDLAKPGTSQAGAKSLPAKASGSKNAPSPAASIKGAATLSPKMSASGATAKPGAGHGSVAAATPVPTLKDRTPATPSSAPLSKSSNSGKANTAPVNSVQNAVGTPAPKSSGKTTTYSVTPVAVKSTPKPVPGRIATTPQPTARPSQSPKRTQMQPASKTVAATPLPARPALAGSKTQTQSKPVTTTTSKQQTPASAVKTALPATTKSAGQPRTQPAQKTSSQQKTQTAPVTQQKASQPASHR